MDAALHERAARIFAARDREHMAPTIAAFEALAAEHPAEAELVYEVAGSYDTAGEEQRARGLYERALAMGLSGDVLRRCLLQYGSTLRILGEFDASLAALDRARRAFPDSAAVDVFRAVTLWEAGRGDAAMGTLLHLAGDHVADLGRYRSFADGNAAELLRRDEAHRRGEGAAPDGGDPAGRRRFAPEIAVIRQDHGRKAPASARPPVVGMGHRRWTIAVVVAAVVVGGVLAWRAIPYVPPERTAARPTSVAREIAYLHRYWRHPNAAYGDFGGTDCVNFTSQALLARGWAMSAAWGTSDVLGRRAATRSWVSSTAMMRWLATRPDLATATDDPAAVRPGDIAQFDWDDSGDRDHTAIVTRVIRGADGSIDVQVAQHSPAGWDRPVATLLREHGRSGRVHYWHLTDA